MLPLCADVDDDVGDVDDVEVIELVFVVEKPLELSLTTVLALATAVELTYTAGTCCGSV